MPRIKIAIATNKNFYLQTLPIVINSLQSNGIEDKDIFVFNAGFDEEESELIDNIQYYKLKQNSYEYSPLIHICEKELESDYWFLIHDTCKVGPKFKELLYNIPKSNPGKIALRNKPSMSIGLYKYDYLLSLKDKLLSIKNTDFSEESMLKWKLWGVPNEDYILWMTPPVPLIYMTSRIWRIINTMGWYLFQANLYNGVRRIFSSIGHRLFHTNKFDIDDGCRVVDYINWYGTNTIRRTEYYKSLDLYKNKSNWGQTGNEMSITT
ncbi:MAG: hypothetical protein PHE73_08940 [Sulfurovaceae bacterium]|nr:hypothetical protein [Sulfurovaceae bacterium]